MPLSKKRKKKEARGPRDREGRPATEPGGGGGFLSGMRGGLKDLAGAGAAKKKESLVSKIVTWVIAAVALYFVARRFGIIR